MGFMPLKKVRLCIGYLNNIPYANFHGLKCLAYKIAYAKYSTFFYNYSAYIF
jgi:hypothetical protein